MKKLIAVAMAAFMALSMTVSAAAAPSLNTPEIQPRVELCGNCGNMTLFPHTETEETHEYRPCMHGHPRGTDDYCYITTITCSQCSICGYRSNEHWTQELKYIQCNGHP